MTAQMFKATLAQRAVSVETAATTDEWTCIVHHPMPLMLLSRIDFFSPCRLRAIVRMHFFNMIPECIFIPLGFGSRRITAVLVDHRVTHCSLSSVLRPNSNYRSRATNAHELARVTNYRLREVLATTAVTFVVQGKRSYLY